MALKLTKLNNIEKAKRLFQHAMVLSPNQHDVLLYYGEFLESNNDFINADHYYLKALMIQPDSPRALFNRRRTLPIVTQLDLEELKRIDMKNECLIKMIKNKDPSLKRLKKEIYFQHIHHSVAIEGNTMSLAETRTIVETRLAVSGKSVVEHNEILGLEAALRFVNQTLVARNSFITVSDILEIHRRVMGHTDPVTAGTFRQSQVFVGAHRPPPASEVEYLMEQFVGMLRGPEITAMHPINIAAFAHHKLVNIHPFLDGNGRTARLLMNLLFMKYGYPPIIIRKEDRSQYYKYLQIANEGDPRPFYRFIAHAAECTLDAFLCSAGQCAQKRIKGSETKSRITDVIPIGQ